MDAAESDSDGPSLAFAVAMESCSSPICLHHFTGQFNQFSPFLFSYFDWLLLLSLSLSFAFTLFQLGGSTFSPHLWPARPVRNPMMNDHVTQAGQRHFFLFVWFGLVFVLVFCFSRTKCKE